MNNKFRHSCIGDNTKENREHLEKLGWKEKYIQEDADIIVCASNTGMFSAIAKDTQDWFKEYQSQCVDCRTNDLLFRAVTAMRSDSDELQYFTNGSSWMKVPIGYDLASFLYADWDGECGLDDINKWHEASLAELQEHFKK